MLVMTRSADAILVSPIDESVLFEITTRLSNPELRVLSTSGLWSRVKLLSQDQNWWHARVCHLLHRSIPREKACWHHVYNSLVLFKCRFHADQDWKCPVLARLLIEEGADPSILLTYNGMRHAGKLYRLVHRGPRLITVSPLVIYSRIGNAQAVAALLADPRVDPTLEESLAFREACAHSRVEVIQLLLRDGRSDPCARKNEAFKLAVNGQRPQVIALLFADSRLQPPSRGERRR